MLRATQLVGGRAPSSELLFSSVGLSFWGGVDPLTSEVVDHTHPLVGRRVGGRVLAVPNGRGSCTGSQVMLEVILNGVAPAAVLLRQPDAILALGVVVAEELFGKSIPVLSLGAEGFEAVARARHVAVEGCVVCDICCSNRPSLRRRPHPHPASPAAPRLPAAPDHSCSVGTPRPP